MKLKRGNNRYSRKKKHHDYETTNETIEKKLINMIISVNEIIKTNEWSVVFVKTAYDEPFIELVNNFCKNLKEFERTLEENEENEKLLDEYEQIANEEKRH